MAPALATLALAGFAAKVLLGGRRRRRGGGGPGDASGQPPVSLAWSGVRCEAKGRALLCGAYPFFLPGGVLLSV